MSKGKMEKTMSTPGSRIGTLLYSLEKLNSSSSDDVEQMRYITAKIFNCTKDQEPVRKQIMSKTTNGLEILLATLESSTDNIISLHVVSALVELLYTGKRATSLVSHGATQILLAALGTASRAQPVSEELMIALHQVLGKIGPKDRKLGVKARLSGALPVTFGLVRTNTANFEVLQPTLQVLKIYAANSVNASHLGKSGAVSCMFRILTVCGRKHITTLRVALDILCQLVKSKSNAARAIGQGGVIMLLTMMCDWHRNDARNRHVKIRKAILNAIKNITALKSGRKALNDANGIKLLYDMAQENSASHCKELDCLVNLISVILRKCSPRNRLPVDTIKSCITFALPQVAAVPLKTEREGDDVIDESDDQDDDLSSSDEQKDCEQVQESAVTNKPTEVQRRSPEDLAMYDHFFRELTEYEEFMQEESDSDLEVGGEGHPIYIPTAGSSASHNSHPHRTHSSSQVPNRTLPDKQHLRENRLSLPNLSRISSLVTSSGQPMEEPPPIQTLAVTVSGIRLDPSPHQENHSSRTNNQSVAADAGSGNIDMSIKGGRASFVVGNPNRSPKQASSSSRYNLRSPPKLRKLSRSLTSLKHSDQPPRPSSKSSKWKLDAEVEEAPPESLRASMTISRMTLRTPSETLPANSTSPESSSSISIDEYSPELYADLMCKTKRVLPFRRIAQPELRGHTSPDLPEFFHEKSQGVQRAMIFEDIDRVIHPDKVLDRVIFDLDTEVRRRGTGSDKPSSTELSSDSSFTVNNGSLDVQADDSPLTFDSQFECGNLRKAVQVRQREYDLILNSDINSNHHHQWFYFEVTNMKSDVPYRFNVINCEKTNSQFNYGMQPVLYSVREAMEGRPHWVRSGGNICYYKNNFARSSAATGGQKGKSYYTFAFTLVFQYTNDICYLAYHYPFTYTMMKVHLLKLEANLGEWSNIYYRNQSLCTTLGGNSCPLLTITSHPATLDREGITRFRTRPFILLSSRVHPGESNSSWVMKGVLKYLMSCHPTAQLLRDTYIFKIIPMLNPDGVINGSHRCSLSGEDLNRRWDNPSPELHPTIYHTKGLLQYLAMCNRNPLVFCDFHGHSRRKNVFMYGCCESQSQLAEDVNVTNGNRQEDTGYKTLPRILNHSAPAFSFSSCSFVVEKAKEATARVVVWKELGVPRSYTMESTYCGCDQGQYKGFQITTAMLEEMGRKFCEGLLRLMTRRSSDKQAVDKTPSQSSLSSGKVYPGVLEAALAKDQDEYGSPGEDVDAMIQASLQNLSSNHKRSRRKRRSNDLDSADDDEDDVENEEDDNASEASDSVRVDGASKLSEDELEEPQGEGFSPDVAGLTDPLLRPT